MGLRWYFSQCQNIMFVNLFPEAELRFRDEEGIKYAGGINGA